MTKSNARRLKHKKQTMAKANLGTSVNSHQLSKLMESKQSAQQGDPVLKIAPEPYGGIPQDEARWIEEGRLHPDWTEDCVGRPWFFPSFTPEMAQWLIGLPLNEGSYPNRKISAPKVKFVEDLIRRGKYLTTNDDFTFDWNGSSGNGQHRLHAIRNVGEIIRGVTIKSGLDPASILIMDTSKPKAESEWYKAQGFSDPTKLAQLVNLYRTWNGKKNEDDWTDTSGRKNLVNSTTEVNDRHLNQEFFNSLTVREKGFAESAIDMTRKVKSNMHVDWAATYTLAFSVLMEDNPISRQAITEFFDELCKPAIEIVAMPDRHPIKRLVKRNYDLQVKANLRHDFSYPPAHRTEFLLRAWNCYATNINMTDIVMKAPFDLKVPFIELKNVVLFSKKRRKS